MVVSAPLFEPIDGWEPKVIPPFPYMAYAKFWPEPPAAKTARVMSWRRRGAVPLHPATGSWFQSKVAIVTIPEPTRRSSSSGWLPVASQIGPGVGTPVATSTGEPPRAAVVTVVVPLIAIGRIAGETPASVLRQAAPVPSRRSPPARTKSLMAVRWPAVRLSVAKSSMTRMSKARSGIADSAMSSACKWTTRAATLAGCTAAKVSRDVPWSDRTPIIVDVVLIDPASWETTTRPFATIRAVMVAPVLSTMA